MELEIDIQCILVLEVNQKCFKVVNWPVVKVHNFIVLFYVIIHKMVKVCCYFSCWHYGQSHFLKIFCKEGFTDILFIESE